MLVLIVILMPESLLSLKSWHSP